VRTLVANAAYCIVYYGLAGDTGPAANSRRSGDWKDADAATVTQALVNEAQTLITQQGSIVALTIIFATKLLWWMANHHIGQGTMYPYMVKVCNAMIPDIMEDDRKTYCHMIGHWASTHRVLTALHIRTNVQFRPFMNPAGDAAIDLTDDIKLRVYSLPAGTARHAVSHASLQKYGQHKLLLFSPRLADLANLRVEVETLIRAGRANVDASIAGNVAVLPEDPRVRYHMGALFLTGGAHGRMEFATPEMTGHLGSMLYHMYTKGTLTLSPSITTGTGADIKLIYQNSDSYDQSWDDKCQGLAAAMVTATSATINKVCGASGDGMGDRNSWVQLQLAIGAYADVAAAEAAYEALMDIIRAPGAAGAGVPPNPAPQPPHGPGAYWNAEP
jgi:hypothetical protein